MHSKKKAKILIVDDIPTNIKILSAILKPNYHIFFSSNGLESIKIAKLKKPDLILLDIMMPGMDGFEVCSILKSDKETKNIPVIFVTALWEEEDEAKGLALGAVDYIMKPVSPAIVRARVKNHLELKRVSEELKKQNLELRDAAILREDIERIARHDLKNPLNGIISIPQYLLMSSNLTEEQRKFLMEIEKAGLRMLEMINRSLDIYKMEKGTYLLDKRPVDILLILDKIIRETESQIMEKDLTFDILIQGQPIQKTDVFLINGEELLLYSLLGNLIKNAAEASPNNQKITIELNKDKNTTICIQNKGSVPEEIRKRFFEKYVTCGKQEGTGIGTYSAKLVTETMGGTISMKSTKKNGVTVRVEFP